VTPAPAVFSFLPTAAGRQHVALVARGTFVAWSNLFALLHAQLDVELFVAVVSQIDFFAGRLNLCFAAGRGCLALLATTAATTATATATAAGVALQFFLAPRSFLAGCRLAE